jgi:hypothetical protein
MRGKIISMVDSGSSISSIQAQYSLSRKVVRGTITQNSLRQEGQSLPRSGCPRTYSERDQRHMLRNLRLFQKSTFDDRRKETGLEMSNSTIKRLAKKHGLQHWRAKKRMNGYYGVEFGSNRGLRNGKNICGVMSVLRNEGGVSLLNGFLDFELINGSRQTITFRSKYIPPPLLTSHNATPLDS